MSEPPIRFINADGSVMSPEPGPIWLESYEYGERMLVPGEVVHTTDHWPIPGVRMDRLVGPGVPSLDWLHNGKKS